MTEFTENFNLEKPAQTDFYNVDVQNSNMDKIETAILAARMSPETEGIIVDINTKIGKTNDAPTSSISTGSLFAKINYLVSSIASYLLNIYNYVIRIGTTTDTGGSTTTGTVMGKLNALQKSGSVFGTNGYQHFTASGTFVVPSGVNKVLVTMAGGCGGGGAGGNGGNTNGTSFGGGAKGGTGGAGSPITIFKLIIVTEGESIPITIGAGGNAGTPSSGYSTDGGNGGYGHTSSFGTHIYAVGGAGGIGGTGAPANQYGRGGYGGIGGDAGTFGVGGKGGDGGVGIGTGNNGTYGPGGKGVTASVHTYGVVSSISYDTSLSGVSGANGTLGTTEVTGGKGGMGGSSTLDYLDVPVQVNIYGGTAGTGGAGIAPGSSSPSSDPVIRYGSEGVSGRPGFCLVMW